MRKCRIRSSKDVLSVASSFTWMQWLICRVAFHIPPCLRIPPSNFCRVKQSLIVRHDGQRKPISLLYKVLATNCRCYLQHKYSSELKREHSPRVWLAIHVRTLLRIENRHLQHSLFCLLGPYDFDNPNPPTASPDEQYYDDLLYKEK